jgi:hypothetical protein
MRLGYRNDAGFSARPDHGLGERTRRSFRIWIEGKVRIDVTKKSVTVRTARARGRVKALPETLALIRAEKIAKGNPLEAARIAGILAEEHGRPHSIVSSLV